MIFVQYNVLKSLYWVHGLEQPNKRKNCRRREKDMKIKRKMAKERNKIKNNEKPRIFKNNR